MCIRDSSYSASAQSDVVVINNSQIDDWILVGLSAGFSADEWSAELFVDNLFDKRAELSRNFVFDRERVTFARPQTVGLRLSYDF